MTLMTDGLTALQTLMNANASISVTYARAGQSVTLSVVPGSLRYEQSDGVIVEDKTRRDWFILAADLILNSVTVTPQRGDTITYAASDRTEAYQVYGDSVDPPWEYTDSQHEQILIRSILRNVS